MITRSQGKNCDLIKNLFQNDLPASISPGDYPNAQELLDAPHPDSYDNLYADLKGDVLNAQGKKEEARAAYQKALEKTDSKSRYSGLIRMKLDALGGKK